MSQWFVAHNGQQLGPFEPAQIKQMAASSQIRLDTLLWKEGMSNWVAAQTIPGLFPQMPPTIPVAAPAIPVATAAAPLAVPYEESPTPTRRKRRSRGKSKTTAGVLGILLGGIGVHKFYLGTWGWGILYVLFFWTYIPAIVGFIEGILFLTKSEEDFDEKYNYSQVTAFTW